MAKKISFKAKHVAGPPKGEPWVWHTAELRDAKAWREMSIHCRRLIERLEREHMAHAGLENGRLKVAYSQLEEWGIGHRYISRAIREAERAGFVEVKRGGSLKDMPSEYRLTYFATTQRTATGATEWSAPTNEWKQREKKSFFGGRKVHSVRGQMVHSPAAKPEPLVAENR